MRLQPRIDFIGLYSIDVILKKHYIRQERMVGLTELVLMSESLFGKLTGWNTIKECLLPVKM